MNLLLDSGYTPPPPIDIVCFLQDGRERLDYIRPVAPAHLSTNVARREDVSAHFIGNYGDYSSVKIYVNEVEVQRNVAAFNTQSILVSREITAGQLEPGPDGYTRIRVVGTEAVSGAQQEIWLLTVASKLPLRADAVAGVPVRPLLVATAAAQVGIRLVSVGHGAAAVVHRLLDALIGRAAGRIFVGEFKIWADSGPSFNIASTDWNFDNDVSLEIQGPVVNADGSITIEISGPDVHSHGSITLNVAQKNLTFDSGMALNIGLLDRKQQHSVTAELWGEQTGDPSGRLVIRVSSLHPKQVAALAASGMKFNFESPIPESASEVILEEIV